MAPLSSDWIPLVRKIFYFSNLTEEELAPLLARMKLLSLPKGAVVFRQGEKTDALYLIHSGRLRLVQPLKDGEKIVAYAGRGEALGEMALLTGEERPHTAVVDSTAELVVLDRADFETLLSEAPAVAIQVSRLLSKHLIESSRARAAGDVFSSKIYALMSRLSIKDRVVFTVNLAIALAEQSRRKVMLLDIMDRESGIFTRALGLEPVKVGEMSLRQEDLQSPEILHRITSFHPSGLEFISLPLSLLEGKLFSGLYPLLSLLRRDHDIILIVLPPRFSRAVEILMEESDNVVFLDKDASTPGEAEILDKLGEKITAEKIFRVRLLENRSPGQSPSLFHIPWRADAGSIYESSGSPYLPSDMGLSHRMIDRLARKLAGLTLGLAMGSGAALGYSIIGVLKVLERHGIYPDILAGTSIGALIGSFYAAGKEPHELEQIATGITKVKLWSMIDFTLPWQGMILGREVLKFLKSVLGDVNFEDLLHPFACVATDIVNGEEIVLRQGKVAEAVRASLSLPFFFQPSFHQGRFLVDGGLVNPVPTSVTAAMGADIIISVNLTTKPAEKHLPGFKNRRHSTSGFWKGPNMLEVVSKTLYTMQYGIAQHRSNLSHVLLEPDMSAFTWPEFHRAADIIKAGEDYTEEALPKIKSQIPFFADSCKVPLRRASAMRLY